MTFAQARQRSSSSAGASRTYPIPPRWRAFLLLCAAACTAGGLASGWAARTPGPTGARAIVLSLLAVALLGFAAYLVAAVRSRLTLAGEVVSIDEPFVHRRLRREEIAGRRLIPLQYGMWYLDLLPRRPHQRKLRISSTYRLDDAFSEWIAPIPDLDAEDAARVLGEVKQELAETLGRHVTPDAVQARLARGRVVARVLTAITVAASAWGFFWPRPYGLVLALLAVLPVAAVAATFAWRGVIVVDERKGDPRPSVALALFVPGCILGLRALMDVSLVSAAPALVAGALAAAALWLAAMWGDASLRKRPVAYVLLGGLLAFWGGGAVVAANVVLDRAPAEVHVTRVVGKHVTRGKATTYDLRLAPWGPIADERDVKVRRGVYQAVGVGDAVTVHLRPGALGIPWFDVET